MYGLPEAAQHRLEQHMDIERERERGGGAKIHIMPAYYSKCT